MSRTPFRPVILLVEDSEDDAFFFRYTLKKTGAECLLIHVADGGAAIQYLEAARDPANAESNPWPDLVFLDLKLPTFSGFEILAWIREQQLGPRLNITVLSGSANACDQERTAELGASGYCVKPISIGDLGTRVARCYAEHLIVPDAGIPSAG